MLIKTSSRIEPPVAIGSNPGHPLARRLVGCWLFNEGSGRVVHDASGHHRNGDFSGGPFWSHGPFGRAINFGGSDDWISMGDYLDLGTDDVTVLAIVKYSAAAQPDEWGGVHFGAIAGKGHLDGAGRGYGLSVNNANQIYWQVRNQASNFTVPSDNALNDGQYHMAVGVCDRDNATGMRLYIDGLRQAATNNPTSIDGNDLNGSRAFAIGSRQTEIDGGWFWDFAGTIAAVYVWKRVLTESEIRQLHRDPFVLFAGRRSVALAAAPVGAFIECAGSTGGQSTAVASLCVSRDLSASVHAVTSTTMTLQVVRDLSGVSAASTTLLATLQTAGIVLLSGTIGGTSGLQAVLSVLASQAAFDAMPQTETPWQREALFHGMTSAAFKLGTVMTQGWFWVRRNGCAVAYRGANLGQIDFSRILCVVEPKVTEFSLPADLSHAPGSAYCYLVRWFNSCGYQERTTASAVMVRITPDGQLAKPSPNAVLALRAEQVGLGKLRLVWCYSPLDQRVTPQYFNIYWDSGSGQVDLQSPIATIPYRGPKFYAYEWNVPDDGQWTFIVTAKSAQGTERLPSPSVSCQARSLPLDPVEILAAEAV